MADGSSFRKALNERAPSFVKEVDALCSTWVGPILERLENSDVPRFPKTFNDPIWGSIVLYPWEVLLLDSPLLQRLRAVRQLGMAHFVYPGAGHGRLEHCRGVVEAAQRMIDALARNAEHQRTFGTVQDQSVPQPSRLDIRATRIAALLHDIGHGPFSHATESLVHERNANAFFQVEQLIRAEFDGATKIAPSETLAVLMIMSAALKDIFEHPKFGADVSPANLAIAIAARIVGSRKHLNATYLSGVVSGPIDADKLDYMPRDCHHSGLPLGLDIHRLISKLEVVTVTPTNAPNAELRERAEKTPLKRFYEIGISSAGLGAYEQMIIARAILYDRIYYHHKVRSAEALVRSLIALSEKRRGAQYSLAELFPEFADDTVIEFLSTEVGDGAGKEISTALRRRNVFHRAYSFAARFIDGLDGLSPDDRKQTKAARWSDLVSMLSTDAGIAEIRDQIFEMAQKIQKSIPELKADKLEREHIVVDLPVNKVAVRGGDILTRTETDHISTPNLFFDPEKWSYAYETQKQCGYVFAPRRFVRLINFAAKIVFCERFQLVLTRASDHMAKIEAVVEGPWVAQLAGQGICSQESVAVFVRDERPLLSIGSELLEFPAEWSKGDPQFKTQFVADLKSAIPGGLCESVRAAVCEAIKHLAIFVDATEKSGDFVTRETLSEKDFQKSMLAFLRARGVEVSEATRIGGGEVDLVLPGALIVENKVRKETANPMDVGENYGWQARRYAIAVSRQILFTVVAYRPTNEKAILPLAQRIKVFDSVHERFVEIRVVVPWGQPLPHDAKSPSDEL